MKNLFVTYELALLAKEKGFDELCLSKIRDTGELLINGDWYRSSDINVPTREQLLDWFREEHDINVGVFPMYTQEDNYETCWGWNIIELKWGIDKEHHIANYVSAREYGLSYYEALTIALTEAFKLIP